jgi:hypothetical protein
MIEEEPKYSDDAKRLAASVNMHAYLGNAGQYAAYKLQDISTDNVAYPSRRAAAQMKWPDDHYWFYLQIPPDGMQLKEAEAYIKYNRKLYEAGLRMPVEMIDQMPTMPNTKEDSIKQIRLLTK